MIVAVVLLVIVCLLLAVVAGFGFGALAMADHLDAATQIAAKRRTLAQLDQAQVTRAWAGKEIDRPPPSRPPGTAVSRDPWRGVA